MKLANYVHMIVIPSEYKDQIMKVVPEQLSDRAFCLSHDKLDVWQWSEKVYSFVRDMAKRLYFYCRSIQLRDNGRWRG